MGQRDILTIMREGQAKTLEQMELLRKQMAGTITPDESVRLAMLTGNLLALVDEAQAQGVGTAVGTGYGEVQPETYEDDYDEEFDVDAEDLEDDILEIEDKPRFW